MRSPIQLFFRWQVTVCVSFFCWALLFPSSPHTGEMNSAWSEPDGHSVTDKPLAKAAKRPIAASFSRFESRFRQICDELAVDGRRDLIIEVSTVQAKEERDCSTCRALWRSIFTACKTKAVPTKRNVAPKKPAKGESDEEAAPTPEVETTEEVVATPKPIQRYPSPVLLDLVSRLSNELHEFSESSDGVEVAVKSVEKAVMGVPTLSVAARDYFDIFFSYLGSSWEGRDDEASEAAPAPDENVDELFPE